MRPNFQDFVFVFFFPTENESEEKLDKFKI